MNKLQESCHWALTYSAHLVRQVSAHMRAAGMRSIQKHQSISCDSSISTCRIVLAFIVICVTFILIPSLFRILSVFRKCGGITKSLKQQVVVCNISSASLEKKVADSNLLEV